MRVISWVFLILGLFVYFLYTFVFDPRVTITQYQNHCKACCLYLCQPCLQRRTLIFLSNTLSNTCNYFWLLGRPSWPWSYDSWIYNYLCNQCLSPLTLWVRIPPRRGVRDTTSYDSWIYNYICNQCLSSLTLWIRIPPRRGVRDTTSCEKVCQWHGASRWFSTGTRVSSTNKCETPRYNWNIVESDDRPKP